MRDNIMESARVLFTQKGIRNSSLRDIAQYVGISDGHLRYYFKTKESLILATFEQMEQQIAAFADTVFPPTAQTILGSLTQSFKVMQRYRYFFTESPDLLAQYAQVAGAYEQLMSSRKVLFMEVFERFQQEGVFTDELDPALFPVLFEQFFILSDNWIRYAQLRQRSYPDGDQTEHYVGVCVALLVPYFSAAIRQQVVEWLKRVV